MRGIVETSLDMLTHKQDEVTLRKAGFTSISQFYAAFTWRGRMIRVASVKTQDRFRFQKLSPNPATLRRESVYGRGPDVVSRP